MAGLASKEDDKTERKPRTRHIRLDNAVASSTVASIINQIDLLVKDNKEEPLYFHINTYGGSVYDGLALYDYIKGLPCPVVTIAEGKVMSMGTILVCAGDIRLTLPNTTFMMHEVSSMSWGKLSSIENDIQETKRLNNLLKKIYSKHLSIDKKEIDSLLKGEDKYLDAQKAKKIGLVDKIASNSDDAWL